MNNYGNKSKTGQFNRCANTPIDENQEEISYLATDFQNNRENFPQVGNGDQNSLAIDTEESPKAQQIDDSPQINQKKKDSWDLDSYDEKIDEEFPQVEYSQGDINMNESTKVQNKKAQYFPIKMNDSYEEHPIQEDSLDNKINEEECQSVEYSQEEITKKVSPNVKIMQESLQFGKKEQDEQNIEQYLKAFNKEEFPQVKDSEECQQLRQVSGMKECQQDSDKKECQQVSDKKESPQVGQMEKQLQVGKMKKCLKCKFRISDASICKSCNKKKFEDVDSYILYLKAGGVTSKKPQEMNLYKPGEVLAISCPHNLVNLKNFSKDFGQMFLRFNPEISKQCFNKFETQRHFKIQHFNKICEKEEHRELLITFFRIKLYPLLKTSKIDTQNLRRSAFLVNIMHYIKVLSDPSKRLKRNIEN